MRPPYIVAILVLVSLLLVAMYGGNDSKEDIANVTIRDRVFTVDIMDDDAERAQGLSGRETLRQDEGMLFLMGVRTQPIFWMKEMRFPLDIIWIDGEMIVDISENVPAPTSPIDEIARVQPSSLADKVLEINAGEASKSGFTVGDIVTFQGITLK